MQKFPKWQIFLIFISCAASIFFSLPSLVNSDKYKDFLPNRSINLGLDLQGGAHLLLEVDFANYLKDQVENLKSIIKQELKSNNIGFLRIHNSDLSVSFKLKDRNDLDKASKILQSEIKSIDISDHDGEITTKFSAAEIENLHRKVIEQSIEIIRRRVDETGTKEPSIQKQGENGILLQLPGLQDPAHLKNLLNQTAKLSFHLVNHESDPESGKIPFGSIILPEDVKENRPASNFLIYKKAVLTGEFLTDAQVSFAENNPVVSFSFDNIGAKKFAEITKKNTGKMLAIVLDGKVISAPLINEPIVGGSGIIKGNFTAKTANDLALLLRAGALPAPLKIIEERTVGPSLGNDSIAAGKISGIIGICAVMGFMVLAYGIFGIFANIALIFNMFFIIAILAVIEATLTMPGIAGIILTMGMAVDANVLIFERIREEAKLGYSAKIAIERGFTNAFTTIFDSNLTTIFAALFLYIFGAGAVKGFAVTLVVGILSSMFSAITLTKFMIYLWYKRRRPEKMAL